MAAALEEDTRQKKLLNNGKIASKNTKFDENLDMTDLDLLDIDEDFEDLGVGMSCFDSP